MAFSNSVPCFLEILEKWALAGARAKIDTWEQLEQEQTLYQLTDDSSAPCRIFTYQSPAQQHHITATNTRYHGPCSGIVLSRAAKPSSKESCRSARARRAIASLHHGPLEASSANIPKPRFDLAALKCGQRGRDGAKLQRTARKVRLPACCETHQTA
jgi:hypothetical protein